MTIQEEIREGMAEKLCCYDAPYCAWDEIPDKGHPSMKDRDYYRRWASVFLSCLHSKGVVIKVKDRELPNCIKFLKQQDNYPLSPTEYFDRGEMERLCPVLKAGCGFFEPLIKDDK